MRLLFATFALCLIPATCLAQQPASVSGAWTLVHNGDYLGAVDLLNMGYASASSFDERDMYGQFLGSFSPFVGQEQRALELFDNLQGPQINAQDGDQFALDTLTPLDAVAAIVSESQGRRIVILNEAHHVPYCRHFAILLARALRKEGFTHFAAETFTSEVDETWQAGYPKTSLGNYSCEPTFGSLVREAIHLGYKGVAYEATPEEMGDASIPDPREQAEARNLARLLSNDPKARVFVYCGYSRACENRTDDGGDSYGWMASYLRELTGRDPLTIDQSRERPYWQANCEPPEWRAVADRIGASVVYQNPDGGYMVFGEWRNQVDMQVFHPRISYIERRPDWLVQERSAHYIQPSELPQHWKRYLLQAFYAGDGPDAVPVDQILVEPYALVQKFVNPPLLLPEGKFRIVAVGESGERKADFPPVTIP